MRRAVGGRQSIPPAKIWGAQRVERPIRHLRLCCLAPKKHFWESMKYIGFRVVGPKNNNIIPLIRYSIPSKPTSASLHLSKVVNSKTKDQLDQTFSFFPDGFYSTPHHTSSSKEQYGDSYLVLKDLRLRCTLAPQDSGGLPAQRRNIFWQNRGKPTGKKQNPQKTPKNTENIENTQQI